MQATASQRKGIQSVADEPTDDGIRDRLRNLSRYTGIPRLAAAIPGVGERTVYNQLGQEPPPMRPRIRSAFLDFLEGVGLLEPDSDARAAARQVIERIAAGGVAEIQRRKGER